MIRGEKSHCILTEQNKEKITLVIINLI